MHAFPQASDRIKIWELHLHKGTPLGENTEKRTLMSRQGPRLRNGVDLQLQSAFADGNWLVAVRLADKRAKSTNDPYFEASLQEANLHPALGEKNWGEEIDILGRWAVVKVCAESQLDDPTAKFAAVSAVWQYAGDGTVVKDVDAIDLLEWATRHLIPESDFGQTIGPLRVRAAKASPKDKNAITRCLESCLLHWDLNSAQQIAAIADRSFPGENHFLFWNIVITHMLATSSQSPPEKKNLYGTLAQKQIERAAQATEQAEAGGVAPARRVKTEEETLLLYDIVSTHGTVDDFKKLMSSPVFSPISQFRRGRKESLQRAVAKYSEEEVWDVVFQLCRQCLSETDEAGQPTLLACDFFTWKHLISAARHLKDADQTVTETVRELLSKPLSSTKMLPMYRRNILLARVSAAFDLGPGDGDEDDVVNGLPSSLRLRELIYYIKDQNASAACFNDIKSFLERLDAEGIKYLAYEHLPQLSDQDSDEFSAARKRLLSLKVQYFAVTRKLKSSKLRGSTSLACAICESEVDSICLTCLRRLSKSAVEFYNTASASDKEASAVKIEILPEIAMLIAACSLNQAFKSETDGTLPPAARRHLLHAVLLLEDQHVKNPTHSQIALMLVQLHLFLGSAYRASEIWEAAGVKRTIVDSLAPIFYDRLSTVSPSLLSPNDDWGEYLREILRTHYDTSLKLRMPRRLIDAFEASSYGSIIKIPEYIEDLRASCTRVMSLTESKRAERFLGLPKMDLINDARYCDVNDGVRLKDVLDYGSFPSWGSKASRPLHLCLRLGPGPSNRRSHLSLLAETFHDLLSFKAPPVYKVLAGSETDHTYVVEMMTRISNSFGKFLAGPDSDLTSSEILYFEAVSLLSALISLCASTERASLADGLGVLVEALDACLETLGDKMADTAKPGVEQTVAQLGSMHDVSMLRDTAAAIRLAAQWVLQFNERERERDGSGKRCLPKELVGQVRSLLGTADEAAKKGQGGVTRLKGEVVSRDFEARLRQWIFDGEEVVAKVLSREVVGEVVESWVTNVKGWGQVKW